MSAYLGEYSRRLLCIQDQRNCSWGGTKLSAEDGFLQFMIERLFQSDAPDERITDENLDEMGDDMKLYQHPEYHRFYDMCRKYAA